MVKEIPPSRIPPGGLIYPKNQAIRISSDYRKLFWGMDLRKMFWVG